MSYKGRVISSTEGDSKSNKGGRGREEADVNLRLEAETCFLDSHLFLLRLFVRHIGEGRDRLERDFCF